MKKSMAIPGFALAIVVAGCDDGTTSQATANISVSEGNYQQQLEIMPDVQRNGVFLRAIRDAGRECQDVVGSTPGGDLQGRPTWTARCLNGVDWLIIVGKDGYVQVVSREEAQLGGLTRANEAAATNQSR